MPIGWQHGRGLGCDSSHMTEGIIEMGCADTGVPEAAILLFRYRGA